MRSYATTTAQLLEMVAWLRQWQVQRVVMESTSAYWKGVYYLEAEGFGCWLVNAREVKNVPGRAKTDRADAVWLARVAERGMCRPSLVHRLSGQPAEMSGLAAASGICTLACGMHDVVDPPQGGNGPQLPVRR